MSSFCYTAQGSSDRPRIRPRRRSRLGFLRRSLPGHTAAPGQREERQTITQRAGESASAFSFTTSFPAGNTTLIGEGCESLYNGDVDNSQAPIYAPEMIRRPKMGPATRSVHSWKGLPAHPDFGGTLADRRSWGIEGTGLLNFAFSVHRWQAHLLDQGAIARVAMEKVKSGVRLSQEQQ